MQQQVGAHLACVEATLHPPRVVIILVYILLSRFISTILRLQTTGSIGWRDGHASRQLGFEVVGWRDHD